jgi:hypothetical protein
MISSSKQHFTIIRKFLMKLTSCNNRSIQPTVMALLDPQGAETLRQNREKLSSNITELINEYGPKVFPDFDGTYW